MKHIRLTQPARLAKLVSMPEQVGTGRIGLIARVGVSALLALAVSGCITLKAPDKPIVIELNINIKQEVIYRLAADAGKTIDSNKEIF